MTDFSLLLFSVRPDFIREAVAGGVSGVVVDWERIGKERRQAFADTEINHQTLEDLQTVRACTKARVICRINGVHAGTDDEIEAAIGAGTDEILVPMVRTVAQVTQVLERVRERCGVGILVETDAAVREVAALARLPLTRVYVGMNDLYIDRRSDHPFRALLDGTVEQVRRHVTGTFGFGGLTVPEGGHPVPCRLLVGEMARLNSSFSLLRRSFHRDTRERDVRREVERILEALDAAARRPSEAVSKDREELVTVVRRVAEESARANTRGA